MRRLRNSALLLATALGCATLPRPAAADWPHWRGPAHDGTSAERGLPATWSQTGENLIWRVDFTGRSTPVVLDGRACATGRAGDGESREELAACFDARDGRKLWERRFPVYHSTVPWNRVGWANPAADPETGYLYFQGVGGLFYCLDSRDGRVVWSKQLFEEFGFMEGYGGRTQTPFVDEDRVVVTFASSGWGDQVIPRHRLYAFDKRTGDLVWVGTPASSMADKNSQSTPAVAVVGGRRLLIHGNGDGWIHALEARTGKKVWSFQLSKRSINTSVVVDGTTVFAAHSEENVDEPTMGRVVAIDAAGSGDVTKTHERWRAPLGVGYASPAFHAGRLFAVDNSANLFALDAGSGRTLWEFGLGTVGKGSPVVADGKIYATEVNGRFHILEPGAEAARSLSLQEIRIGDRPAEIYGSAAVAYGRVYFTTEEGFYCLGDRSTPFLPTTAPAFAPAGEEAAPAGSAAATLLVVPGEVSLRPGERAAFRVEAFDALGRPLGARDAEWSLDGLAGAVAAGTFTADPAAKYAAGKVVAKAGDLTAAARVRVVADLPFADGFDGWATGAPPPYLVNAAHQFKVEELEGERVLAKPPSPSQLNTHQTFLARSEWSGYTVQADVRATRVGRRMGDVGIIDSGYWLVLLGAHQRLQLVTWPAERRIERRVDFPWQPDAWYTMKLSVEQTGSKAVVRGKVWPRGEAEPAEWTLTAEDPVPVTHGSPGFHGFSPTPIYFDNVKVTRNDR